MQDKAYTTGSVCPPLSEPGKLRIYSMRFCPYAHRVLLVASTKNIPFEIVNINTMKKPEWYLEKNDEGKVPLLEFCGKFVGDSLIIAEYLDDAFPQNKLISDDPYQKAKDKMLIEKFGKVSMLYYTGFPVLVTGNKEKWDEVFKLLEFWETQLLEKGTAFYHGNKAGMLDFMIWPWMERLNNLTIAFDLVQIPKEKFPKLTTWIASMQQDPAVKQHTRPLQMHKGFFESWARGEPNLDFGV